MAIINRLADFHDEMTHWRRQLHSHPEICYEEVWTSDFIARNTFFAVVIERACCLHYFEADLLRNTSHFTSLPICHLDSLGEPPSDPSIDRKRLEDKSLIKVANEH